MPVIPRRQPRRNRVRPDVSGRWRIRRLAAFVVVKIAALRVTRRPELLRVVRRDPGRRPVMPVRAHIRVDVKIVEQHKLARQLVMIRRGILIEQRQRRIAISLPELPQHLIVSAIFLDDVNHVLDRRRPARLRIDHVIVGKLRHVEFRIVIGRKRHAWISCIAPALPRSEARSPTSFRSANCPTYSRRGSPPPSIAGAPNGPGAFGFG